MAAYVVTAPAVQVVVEARVYFLERGASVPEGVAEDVLAHLVGIGYIAEAEVEAEPVPDTEKPLDKMTTAKLVELAASEGIDLSNATKNADRVAAIVAAREASTEPEPADPGATEPVPAGSDSSNL